MSDASPAEKQAIAGLLRGIASLPSLRSQVSAQIIPSSRAFSEYNAIVQQSYRVLSAAIRQQNNAQLVAQALAFVRMGQSEDMLAQENTLLTAGQSSRQFTPADLQAFTQLVGSRRAFYNLTLPDLDPQYRAYYTRAISPRAYLALLSLENTVVGTRPGAVPRRSRRSRGSRRSGVGAGFQAARPAGSERAHEPGRQRGHRCLPPAVPGRRPGPGRDRHSRRPGPVDRAPPGARAVLPAGDRAGTGERAPARRGEPAGGGRGGGRFRPGGAQHRHLR